MNFHENLLSIEKTKKASNKSFALVMGTFFLGLGLLKAKPIYSVIGVGFLALGYFRPSVLEPLNQIWFWIGEILNKIISPIILFIMFVGIFCVFGFLMWVFGKRPISMRFDKSMKTNWKPSEMSSFKDQF